MTRTYITPRALCRGEAARQLIAAGRAHALCGDALAFAAAEITTVEGGAHTAAVAGKIPDDVLKALAAPRTFAGLGLDRPRIMGIVNVTPDSFADGGRHATTEAAIAHGVSLAEEGADILDIGGESTRPGAAPVSIDEEQRRVLPVVTALANRGLKVSIDTRNAATMEAALTAGAAIVNDVTALSDPGALAVVTKSGAPVVLMHMKGEPRTMQKDPRYDWAPGDIYDFLGSRVRACRAAGIGGDRIAIDPGIGFGQNDLHIAQVLDHLAMLHGLGHPIVFGASRKSFIGRWSAGEGAEDRLAGSLAVAIHAASQGAQILRVHDVRETRQALAIADGISHRNL